MILLSLSLNVLGAERGQSLEGYFDGDFYESFCYDFRAEDQPKHPVEYIFPTILKMLILLNLHLESRRHPESKKISRLNMRCNFFAIRRLTSIVSLEDEINKSINIQLIMHPISHFEHSKTFRHLI